MEYEHCDKCGYALLEPSFLSCPMCGTKVREQPYIGIVGFGFPDVNPTKAEERLMELLTQLEKDHPELVIWLEGDVVTLAESDRGTAFSTALREKKGEDVSS